MSHADAYAIIHREDCKEVTATATYNSPCEEPDPATGYGNWSAAYSFGVKVAEVNVDTETGAVEVLRVVSATDAGTVVNPHAALGQIEGGVLMGVGYALMEDFQVENGRPVNPSWLDYKLPTTLDVPKIEVVFVESENPDGPYGAKGLGGDRPARHFGGHRQRRLRRCGSAGNEPSRYAGKSAECPAPEGGGSRLETSRGLNEHCGFGGTMMTLLGEKARRAFGDIAISLVLFGIMGAGFWSLTDNKDILLDFGNDPGPGLFPSLLLWALGLCGLALLAVAIWQLWRAGAEEEGSRSATGGWRIFLNPSLLVACLFIYVYAIGTVGFLPSTICFALLWVFNLGIQDEGVPGFRTVAVYSLEALAVSFVIYLIFAKIIKVPLP